MPKINMGKLEKPKSKDILDAEEETNQKELLTGQIIIKVRPSEKLKFEKIAEDKGLKLSPLLRSILKKHGYI